MNLCPLGGRYDSLNQFILFIFVVNYILNIFISYSSICDIVKHRIVEQDAVLRHDRNITSEVSKCKVFDVLPIDENLAFLDVIESVD